MGIGKLKIPEGVSAKHAPLLTTLANDYNAAYETGITRDLRSEDALVTAEIIRLQPLKQEANLSMRMNTRL